jgi:purine-binding chemotaxis protein CheW
MENSINKVVVFQIANISYGININCVQEIIRLMQITPIVQSDATVEGVINLRGIITPVINLARLMGIPENERTNDTRIIVVEFNQKKVGLIVDKVMEVGTYTADEVEVNPKELSNTVSGVVKKKNTMWLLLSLSEIL